MNFRHFGLAVFSLLLLTSSLFGGSRGVSLAFLDATTGSRSPASLRLAELLVSDMKALYSDPQLASAFPWSEPELDLQVGPSQAQKITFDRLLNPDNPQAISAYFERPGSPDGLVVYFHDSQGGYVRFKLYSWDGQEVILLRLPLEGKGSAMPGSLLRGHRRGALIALGAAVRWSP